MHLLHYSAPGSNRGTAVKYNSFSLLISRQLTATIALKNFHQRSQYPHGMDRGPKHTCTAALALTFGKLVAGPATVCFSVIMLKYAQKIFHSGQYIYYNYMLTKLDGKFTSKSMTSWRDHCKLVANLSIILQTADRPLANLSPLVVAFYRRRVDDHIE